MDIGLLRDEFRKRYNSEPRIFRSPGRINLIGEHTDYNDGLVLPAAVDKELVVLAAKNGEKLFRVYSIDEDQYVEFTLGNYREVKEPWAQYIIGIIDQIIKKGTTIEGIDCAFGGNVPIGAGMSSSAALECATLFGLNELFELGISKMDIALMAQKAENEYVGVNCGIMDQYASVFSEPDYFLKIDCRDLSFERYKLHLEDFQLVLIDTMVKHSLASSEYNVRRQECEEGVKILQQENSSINSLRDATIDEVIKAKPKLTEKVYERCKYVVEEIARVEEACKAITDGDVMRLGQLMFETHNGLQTEYEVSCEELDYLVELAHEDDGVIGARMMGGGFGGCTINLIRTDHADEIIEKIGKSYHSKYGKYPNTYKVKTALGSSEVILDSVVN